MLQILIIACQVYCAIHWDLERGVGGGGGGSAPTFLLLFYENPTFHFLFILLSQFLCPILANQTSQKQSNPKSHIVFCEILGPKNILPDPDSLTLSQLQGRMAVDLSPFRDSWDTGSLTLGHPSSPWIHTQSLHTYILSIPVSTKVTS